MEQILKGIDRVEEKLNKSDLMLREHGERLVQLEQRRGGAGIGVESRAHKSDGEWAADQLREHADLLAKTKSVRMTRITKAASDPVTTSSGRRVITGGAGAPAGRVLGLQYGLPQSTGGGTAIEYSRYTALEGAAAQQATEGAAKAAVRPTHSIITQTAITIAGYTKMSRQALSDSAAVARAVDVTLRRSVDTAVDVALVNGATGFTGGYEGLATAYTSLVYDSIPDAVSEACATLQTAGFNPDLVALNPADWLAVTVARGALNDHYLSGSYLGTTPLELRGLRVVLSPSIDAGKALVMDSSHTELVWVDGFAVEVAYDGSDFTSNLVTVLGEVRFIPIFLTVGSARLITPA